MFSHIHSCGIIVKDQDAALAWYQSLGWDVRSNAEMGPGKRFLTVAPKGSQCELALGTRAMYGDDATNDVAITLIVEDVDATVKALREKGATVTFGPEDMPWGARGASFLDPDGNEFFISTRA